MRSKQLTLRATWVAALSGLLALSSLTSFANTPTPTGLFSEPPVATVTKPPKNAIKGKSRAVKINRQMLRKGRFFVSLPDGVSFEVVRTNQQEKGKERLSWVGHASDDPGSRAVFAASGDAVAGTLAYNDKLFKLEPRADGSHVLSEVMPTDPAPELDPIAVADQSLILRDPGSTEILASDTNAVTIDVLVAYTPAVGALYGAAGAEALILQAVAEANQAYANSGMSTRLNLVRSVQTNYVESGDMTRDLSRLRSTNDGYMDELHSLRDTYGADLVSLIENDPQYCGLAYRMATLSTSFASSAFSIVHHSCATGYYSFAHEIGHNQGAHHDAANASGAIFPYAYGYLDPNNLFRTIMSYNCPGGCTRIGYFSNAEIFYNGVPTGYSGAAENADAIDNTAATVARFRQGVVAVKPAAPSALNAIGSSTTQVDLAWTDNANDESGFHLERSIDGVSFNQIANLPANSTNYRDSGLTENVLYYYRARAWNSGGNSSYTNIATVSTLVTPQFVDQLVTVESTVAGRVRRTYLATQVKDGVQESIKEIASSGSSSQQFSYLEHYWAIFVSPGATVTLHADVSTKSATQKFTFAYSTVFTDMATNKAAWIDMFNVSASTSGAKQFTLPSNLSGWVFVSVRDNKRQKGVRTSDSVRIDYLAVRTASPTGAF